MSNFGDFEPDDAYDTEPADPEQVAIKLQKLRRDAGLDDVEWERISTSERATIIEVVAALLTWMRRQGAT
jgi:hypothetical protein